MLTKELFGLDQAIDIAMAAVACKKSKQYNLANIYFKESLELLSALVRENKVPKEKQEKIKPVIQSSDAQAKECARLFDNQVQELKQDKYCAQILKNIVVSSDSVSFGDIVGLDAAKKVLKETLILPNLRPDLFSGLRSPPRGILFYGPPGNGKTFLAKAVCKECRATFINISASSIVSQWLGEGEKLMKALFKVANVYQPSIIFIDEIDSLLSERKDNEHEASRRVKTEFLVNFDGICNSQTDRISLIGATNLPHYLDPAVLRRFGKKIYIPLPDEFARFQMISSLISTVHHTLSEKDIVTISHNLEFYSANDVANLVKEAAMEPLREITNNEVKVINKYKIRAVNFKDFETARKTILPSVTKKDILVFLEWESKHGKV